MKRAANKHTYSKGSTTTVDEGDFYLTFHFHTTRP